MSSVTSVQHRPEVSKAKNNAANTPSWVWLAYASLAILLFSFVQKLLLGGLIAYVIIRAISAFLYERYSSKYQDYETEYPDLFRDINDILGVNANAAVKGFSSDISAESKEQIEREKKLLHILQRKNNYEMSRKERWQLASLSERYAATAEPLRLFLIYKADYPTDLDADYLIGKVLLDKNNASGLAFLKKAFKKFNLVLPICEVLSEYYYRIDNEVKLNYWHQQKEIFSSVATEAQLERVSLMPKDELLETTLDQKWLERISEQLSAVKNIKAAWICEKIVTHYPEYPVYILLVKCKHFFVDEQKILTLLNSELDFPDTTLVISQSRRYRKHAKKIRKQGVKIAL